MTGRIPEKAGLADLYVKLGGTALESTSAQVCCNGRLVDCRLAEEPEVKTC